MCAINTDTAATRSAWVTIDAGLNDGTGAYVYRHHSDPAVVRSCTRVEARNGRAISVSLPPAGFAVSCPEQARRR